MSHDRYYQDLALAWTIRCVLIFASIICFLAVGGCNYTFTANSTGTLINKDPAPTTVIN